MREDVKTEWVRRLESGLIPQARRRLGLPDGSRCCLGVLCDIAVEEGVIKPPRSADGEGEEPDDIVLVYADEAASLPAAVMEWAELDSDFGWSGEMDLSGYEEKTNLASLNDGDTNDGHRCNFEQIAAIIKEKL